MAVLSRFWIKQLKEWLAKKQFRMHMPTVFTNNSITILLDYNMILLLPHMGKNAIMKNTKKMYFENKVPLFAWIGEVSGCLPLSWKG